MTTPAQLASTAADIAARLGDGWTTSPDHHGSSHVLQHRDGYGVLLQRGTHGGQPRIYARGTLPPAPDDVDLYTSDLRPGQITMAAAKTPARMAEEIRRRLLPTARAALDIWRGRVERLRAHEAARTAAAGQLAALPGVTLHARSTYSREPQRHLAWSGAPRGGDGPRGQWTPQARVEVNADDTGPVVTLQLRGLDAEQAERVLRALAAPGPA